MNTRPHPAAYDEDLYRLLQVAPRASHEVIDAAYKALLKSHAPRKAGDSESLAQKLGEAHLILSDPGDRRKYDDYRRDRSQNTIGPYRLIRRVAQGGFGVTYQAKHLEHGKLACIKHCSEISPQAEEILKQETKSIWDLAHYGIPNMKDLIKLADGSYALAMSWVEGPTLQQAVETHGKLDAESVAWISERILNTLTYLHHHGVVHGDIKPQNIIVQEEQHLAVLVDFGLATVKPSSTTQSKGHTELFSPPEQIAGKTPLPESDLYSLGMTMIYALTGDYQLTHQKRVPAYVPDPLCDFIRSLIVRDILARPRDAGALFEQLKLVRQKSFGRERSGMKKMSAN